MKFGLFKSAVSIMVIFSLLLLLPAETTAQSPAPANKAQSVKAADGDGPKAMGAGEKGVEEVTGKSSKLWLYVLIGAAVVGVVVAVVLLTKKKKSSTPAATTGSIQANSTPAGAQIFLDGVDTTKVTNATLTGIAPGSHDVKLVLKDYNDFPQTVTVQAGQTAQVTATLIPLSATTGIIQVNSTPAGARIYLDGADTGKTTNAPLALIAPGNHTIGLTLSGYRDFSQTVAVVAGQTATVTAALVSTGVLEPVMVRLPAGTFLMGSDSAESNAIERPTHQVTLSSFEIGKYEVKQSEFISVMGMNPSAFRDSDQNPLEQVSWDTVQTYIRQLNTATGKSYRLPTEAEWEYACRAGTTGDRYGDLNSVAWYNGNSGMVPHVVGGKLPNAFGLYDMLGNLWEWCSDWYGPYSAAAVTNPQGPASGSRKVLRGGSWYQDALGTRASDRYTNGPGLPTINWGDDLGFRVVRN